MPRKTGPEDLKSIYEDVYAAGEEKFFTKYSLGSGVETTEELVLSATSYEGRKVVDLGCGTGHLAFRLATEAGPAQVLGVDFSPTAIEQATRKHEAGNLRFEVGTIDDLSEPADVFVTCGTLEHLPDPAATLGTLGSLLPQGGEILFTVPCFLNLRGFVWMTLQKLFDVPMSLTDRHFISPKDVEGWLSGSELELVRVESFEHDLGNGHAMVKDLQKRLPAALGDAHLDASGVDDLLRWLSGASSTLEAGGTTLWGAMAFYQVRKVAHAA